MDEKYNMHDTAPGPQPGAGESATRAQTCAPPDPMPPLREEPPKKVRRAGTFTLGLVLVAAGVLLVLSSVLPSFDMRWVLRLAPVVFIGLVYYFWILLQDRTLLLPYLTFFQQ